MRYLTLVFLLLGTTFVLAQNPSNNPPSPNEASEAKVHSGAAANRDMTVKGCLSGTDGNYLLTDAHGTSYQVVGDTSKLAEHVGHEIKVTGGVKTPGAGTEANAGTSQNPSTQPISVTSVKHIAKSCPAGTGNMSK